MSALICLGVLTLGILGSGFCLIRAERAEKQR